jgi:hypothetical protein
MRRITIAAILFLFALGPAVGSVVVSIKDTTDLRDRLNPQRVIIEVPAGAAFQAERVEGDWLHGVYEHAAGVSRGMIRKDAVADSEKLAKLEEEYQERERIRIEQEMRAKGLVNYEEEWVTPEERARRELEKFEAEQRAKGLVKFEGQWMTPEEMNRIVAERHKKEVETLIADLKDPKIPREQKDMAERRLIGIGKHAVQPLMNELKGPDRALRGTAALLLGRIGGDDVLQPLLNALEDEDACAGAAAGLGELGSRAAVEKLIGALRDEDAVRAAAEALGKIGDVRAVEPLIQVLQDFYEDDATHAAVAKALGMIGDSRAAEPLRQVAETNKNPLVREAARLALDNLKALSPTPK